MSETKKRQLLQMVTETKKGTKHFLNLYKFDVAAARAFVKSVKRDKIHKAVYYDDQGRRIEIVAQQAPGLFENDEA